MAMIQATPANKPVFRRSGDDFRHDFNVSSQPQFLAAPIPAGLPGATHYTFACWMNRRGNLGESNNNPPIFVVSVAGGSTTTGAGISRRAATIVFAGPGANPANSTAIFAENALGNDRWHHVAGVMTPTEARIYFDGVLQSTDTSAALAAMPSNMGDFLVSAAAARDGTRWVPVGLSNLQIWNIALTQQQVQDWAMPRLPRNNLPAGLIGYWPL